jgi:hypothetical protein
MAPTKTPALSPELSLVARHRLRGRRFIGDAQRIGMRCLRRPAWPAGVGTGSG